MADLTYSELAQKMRQDMARGSWRIKSYEIDGIRREFASASDFLEVLRFVEQRAAEETTPYNGRVSMGSATR